MNWTEYDSLTREQLYDKVKELEEVVETLELDIRKANRDGIKEGYNQGYADGLDDGEGMAGCHD